MVLRQKICTSASAYNTPLTSRPNVSDITQLLDDLSEALDRVEPGADWQAAGPTGKSRKCDIYELFNNLSEKRLALKVYRSGVSSEQAPQIQYRAMERVAKAATASKLLIAPTPITFIPEDRAILMSWQDAERLQNHLWQRLLSPGKRLRLIENTGRWLRAFHDISCIAPAPFDANKLAKKLTGKLHAPFEKPGNEEHPILKNQTFRTAWDRFHAGTASLDASVPHALLHGDFTSSNILVDGNSIIGIDMWGARLGPVYEDAARLLTYLAIQSPYSFSTSPLHPDGALISAFAKGYGRDVLNIQSNAWNFILLYQQLRRWIAYEERLAHGASGASTHWLINRTIRIVRQTMPWLSHH